MLQWIETWKTLLDNKSTYIQWSISKAIYFIYMNIHAQQTIDHQRVSLTWSDMQACLSLEICGV